MCCARSSASTNPAAEPWGGADHFWPLFGLVVRTPRLELRLLREEEFADLVALVDAGIHDPGAMPFFVPWTDVEPRRRAREAAQWMWRHRANWSPNNWTLTCGVFVGGKPVGVQDLEAEHFRAVRSVETGSWLGRAHQGLGLGGRCVRRFCTWPSPASAQRRR